MGQRDPLEQLHDAEQIARSHNMFVIRQGERFLLYRRTRTRPVFLGARSEATAFCSLVSRCATTSRK